MLAHAVGSGPHRPPPHTHPRTATADALAGRYMHLQLTPAMLRTLEEARLRFSCLPPCYELVL